MTRRAECKGGNIFGLIVDKITDVVLQWSEYQVNWAMEIIEGVICGWFGCNLGRVCLTVGENVYRCEHAWGGDNLEWMLGCGYRADTRESRQCFFARQKSICMHGDASRYNRYQKLFEVPNKEELEQDFFSIVGKYTHMAIDLPFGEAIIIIKPLCVFLRTQYFRCRPTNAQRRLRPAPARVEQRRLDTIGQEYLRLSALGHDGHRRDHCAPQHTRD